MKVLFFWEKHLRTLSLEEPTNPYGPLLARAMAKRGVTYELGDYSCTREWLERQRASCDVLHLNWLRHFYHTDDHEQTARRRHEFGDKIQFAKSIGFRVVWTFHNLYPHERVYQEIDHAAQEMMCRCADAIICHCRHAAELVSQHFGQSQSVHVIPHGNYIDAYPNEVSREAARRELGIPENEFVYWFAGNARPYKGIDRLIETFLGLGQNHRLLLSMRTGLTPAYVDRIMGMVQDSRITCVTSSFFPREEIQIYANAADVAVLPFTDVLTSGSAILALGFGKPVIVPGIGCLPELVDDSCGILFDPRDRNGLKEAMMTIPDFNIDLMSDAAYKRAEHLGWDVIAGSIAALYGD